MAAGPWPSADPSLLCARLRAFLRAVPSRCAFTLCLRALLPHHRTRARGGKRLTGLLSSMSARPSSSRRTVSKRPPPSGPLACSLSSAMCSGEVPSCPQYPKRQRMPAAAAAAAAAASIPSMKRERERGGERGKEGEGKRREKEVGDRKGRGEGEECETSCVSPFLFGAYSDISRLGGSERDRRGNGRKREECSVRRCSRR